MPAVQKTKCFSHLTQLFTSVSISHLQCMLIWSVCSECQGNACHSSTVTVCRLAWLRCLKPNLHACIWPWKGRLALKLCFCLLACLIDLYDIHAFRPKKLSLRHAGVFRCWCFACNCEAKLIGGRHVHTSSSGNS